MKKKTLLLLPATLSLLMASTINQEKQYMSTDSLFSEHITVDKKVDEEEPLH